MDTAPQFGSLAAALASDAPILLITDTQTATEVLAQLAVEKPIGLPTAPHTAAAWTARRGNGAPVLAVSAQDAPSLQALLRPLPHYGGQSYVLFEGRRAAHKGVWPLPRGPLFHAFDDTQ